MANKTFHIPKADEPMWDAVRRVADRDGTSQYRVVADALAEHLPRRAASPSPEDRWADIAADAA